MEEPFDARFRDAMDETTMRLVEETGARMGYTQSDEITLVLYSPDPKSEVWFNGRVQKIVSHAAALTTMEFGDSLDRALSGWAHREPMFDSRAWQVPTLAEAANVFLWRERDAVKNSITAAAQSVYSDKELHGKNSDDKLQMLLEKGILWMDYEARFKRGTYVQRHTISGPFTAEEIKALPPKHEARSNPDLMVERSRVEIISMPPFGTVLNREAVIFDGAKPETATLEPLSTTKGQE
jgi:tRNA(His) 5'-end guanylyltransferase